MKKIISWTFSVCLLRVKLKIKPLSARISIYLFIYFTHILIETKLQSSRRRKQPSFHLYSTVVRSSLQGVAFLVTTDTAGAAKICVGVQTEKLCGMCLQSYCTCDTMAVKKKKSWEGWCCCISLSIWSFTSSTSCTPKNDTHLMQTRPAPRPPPLSIMWDKSNTE